MTKLLIVQQNSSDANTLPSLQEAFDLVKESAGKETVRIQIKGDYLLEQPLVLTNEHFNQGGKGVIVEGIDNATITGGKKLSGFVPYPTDDGRNLFVLPLPEVERTRHLYIDGASAPRPCTEYRKSSAWNIMEADDFAFVDKIAEYDQGDRGVKTAYKGILTTHTEYAAWRNPEDIEMVFETGWTHSIIPVVSWEPTADGKLYIHPLLEPFHVCQIKGGVQIGPCPNYLENVFELLSQPGQWYFDRKEHKLYLCLAQGDLPEHHEIILPLTEQLLVVDGDRTQKPANLTFRNLRFCHTTFLDPATEGHAEIQANILAKSIEPYMEDAYITDDMYYKTHSALQIRGAKGVSFERCRFEAMGNGAIDFEFGAEDCAVIGCEFTNLAGSALQIGDFNLTDAHPKCPCEIVRGIRVSNNYIHHTGLDYKGSVAVCIGYAQDITVEHNEICFVPYTAVSVGWGWATADMTLDDRRNHLAPPSFPRWKEPSVSKRNHVVYNHIHHAMQRLHDGGAIYTLGVMEGTSIIGNLLHDSAGFEGDGYNGFSVGGIEVEPNPEAQPYHKFQGFPGGVYMDEGSVGIEVRENIFYHIAVPLFYHNQIIDGYKKVTVKDNFINCKPGQPEMPKAIADFAGLEFGYQDLLD